MHKHKCYKCGTTWEHDCDALNAEQPRNLRHAMELEQTFIEAHYCPQCGKLEWAKYFGTDRPRYTGRCVLDSAKNGRYELKDSHGQPKNAA